MRYLFWFLFVCLFDCLLFKLTPTSRVTSMEWYFRVVPAFWGFWILFFFLIGFWGLWGSGLCSFDCLLFCCFGFSWVSGFRSGRKFASALHEFRCQNANLKWPEWPFAGACPYSTRFAFNTLPEGYSYLQGIDRNIIFSMEYKIKSRIFILHTYIAIKSG